jgi:hypothetical protein
MKDVFSNIYEIKTRHELLLQALYKTQQRNYHQVHSIMDDLLEAVSNGVFQRAYVDYISVCEQAHRLLIHTNHTDRTSTTPWPDTTAKSEKTQPTLDSSRLEQPPPVIPASES